MQAEEEVNEEWSIDKFYSNYAENPDNAIKNILPSKTQEQLIQVEVVVVVVGQVLL